MSGPSACCETRESERVAPVTIRTFNARSHSLGTELKNNSEIPAGRAFYTDGPVRILKKDGRWLIPPKDRPKQHGNRK